MNLRLAAQVLSESVYHAFHNFGPPEAAATAKFCIDEDDQLGHVKFVILDKINNADNLSAEEMEDLLLQKENFWIGTVVTQRKGMNGTHD